MRITFVYPDFSLYMDGTWSDGRFNVGVGYLSAVLKRAGHQTTLLHITEPAAEEAFVHSLRGTNPDLVAFSSTTHMYPHVKELAGWARRGVTVPIIYGGVHPTLDPDGALETDGIDMICVGEGEYPLLELCDCLERGEDYKHISNLWFKEADGIRRNPTRPLIENLDDLPIPDRSLFDYDRMDDRAELEGALMASRGCPFNCTYCCNHAFKSRYPNQAKYVRFRSVDHVITELRQMVRDYPWMDHFFFHDDILNMKRDWFEEFVVRYKQEIGLPFRCYARANMLDEDSVRRFAEAGCYQMDIGVESGNPWIRENVLNRYMSNDTVIKAFSLAREYGVGTKSLNMLGLPYETLSRALDTIKLNAIIRPSNEIQFSILYPYPHTQLYELCREKGFLTDKVFTGFFESSVLKLDTISEEVIRYLARHHMKLIDWYTRIFSWPAPAARLGERAFDRLLASPAFRRWFADGDTQELLPKVTQRANEAEADWRVEIVAHKLPPVMEKGRIYKVPVTFKNTGRHVLPTPRMSVHAVNVAYHWLDANGQMVIRDGARTALARGLATGETDSLEARVQAPDNEGSYTLVWDFVHENVAWLSDLGSPTTSAPVQVRATGATTRGGVARFVSTALAGVARALTGRGGADRALLSGYRAKLLKHTLPNKMRANERYFVRLRLQNSGNQLWLPPGNAGEFVSVGYEWRSSPNGGTPSADRVTLPGPVAPGEQVEIRVPVHTPPTQGDYQLTWRLYLGANGTHRPLQVRLPESRVVTYT